MDGHKDRRAGLLHSDGLAINSTRMGFISYCTLATSFTDCATHALPAAPPPLASWLTRGRCPPARVLRECHSTAPPGHTDTPLSPCRQVCSAQLQSCAAVVPYPDASPTALPPFWSPGHTPAPRSAQKAQPHTDAPRLGLCHVCLHTLSQPTSLLPSQANSLEAFEFPSTHTSSPPPRTPSCHASQHQPPPATPAETHARSSGEAAEPSVSCWSRTDGLATKKTVICSTSFFLNVLFVFRTRSSPE